MKKKEAVNRLTNFFFSYLQSISISSKIEMNGCGGGVWHKDYETDIYVRYRSFREGWLTNVDRDSNFAKVFFHAKYLIQATIFIFQVYLLIS